MNLHFRLILTVVFAYFKTKMTDTVESRKTFTVFPTDAHLPFFRALCGGRYFDFMDLARVDQVTRLGMLDVMLKKGLGIHIAGQFLQYKKPLKTFRRFSVLTKIAYWDEKFFYVEHKFEQDGIIKVSGLIQACFRGKTGICPPAKLLSMVGINKTEPAMPKQVQDWLKLRQAEAH